MFQKDVPMSNYIRDFVERSRMRMQPFILTGELNREYIRGNQHRKIDKKVNSIVEKDYPTDTYLEKKVFNRMLSIYLTRNGILSDNKPIPGFQPDNGDAKNVSDSVEGNKFIKEFLKQSDFQSTFKKIVKSGDIFPMVWLKTGIDWTQGDTINTRKVKVKRNNKTINKNFVLREGREYISVVPIYEVFPDNLKIDSSDEMKEFVYRKPMSLSNIESKFGFDAKEEQIDPIYGKGFNEVTAYNTPENKYAYVHEYYKNPDSQHPRGRYIILINDYIVHEGPLPFENGPGRSRRIPFDCITLQAIDGYLPGITVYSQLIDQQDTYNAINNRLLEYINRLGIGKKYVWKGSLINEDRLSNKPGSVTKLTRFGRMPQNDVIDKIGQEVTLHLRTLQEEMLVTAGLSALTAYGQSKSNVRTDGVADKIAESDSNKLTNALKNISEGTVKLIKKIIYLEQQRQRTLLEELKLAKKDEYSVKYNISSIDPEEVTIVNSEFLMQNDQIIEKKMAQAGQYGLYNKESGISFRSKVETLDMLQAQYLKDTLDPIERANWGRIQTEHSKIFEKEPVEVKDYELHQMHIEEHTYQLLSPQLEELKIKDPELHAYVEQTLEMHIDEHKKLIQGDQNKSVYDNAKALIPTARKSQGVKGTA